MTGPPRPRNYEPPTSASNRRKLPPAMGRTAAPGGTPSWSPPSRSPTALFYAGAAEDGATKRASHSRYSGRSSDRVDLGGPIRSYRRSVAQVDGALLRARPASWRGPHLVPARTGAARSDLRSRRTALDLCSRPGAGGRERRGHAEQWLCVPGRAERRVHPHRLPGPTLGVRRSPAQHLRAPTAADPRPHGPGGPDSLPRHPWATCAR